jgi:hypothetical protein
MAIKNFISTIWSENLLTALDAQYVGVANCNRDYDGDIKEKGSIVKICGVGDVSVKDYSANTDIDTQTLSDTCVDLCIDQAKYFNFQIDDVDRAQSSPKLMDAAMKVAADKLAKAADKFVYSLPSDIDIKLNVSTPDDFEAIEKTILRARQILYYKNGGDSSEVVLELPPEVAHALLKRKIATATDNKEMLETGCIGHFYGCKVFVTPNLEAIPDGNIVSFKAMMRTKRAIAFAEQISEVEAYRPEKRFADAVKGLHLYGAKIVYPEEIIGLSFTLDLSNG